MEIIMLLSLGMILIGFILLTYGADLLVKGAGRLALLVGISPLVVGLTVVAFGTSAPEAAVSLKSALIGKVGITVGNVVGSNIFNTFVVLGVASLIAPLVVHAQVIRKEVPLLVGASFLLLVLSLDGVISRWDGVLLFVLIVAYTWWSIHSSRRESSDVSDEYGQRFGEEHDHSIPDEVPGLKQTGPKAVFLNLFLLCVGIGMLIFGSNMLVNGAVAIAEFFGVSDLIIGLTIVSIGTSLPELATSIMAGIRGERDIAVGNAVGSSLFNILAVLGLSGLASPSGVPVASSTLHVDLPVMIFSALACLPVFLTSHKISRGEGVAFILYYCIYIAYLILDAAASPHLFLFIQLVLYIVVPLTVIFAAYLLIKGIRQHRRGEYTLKR
jgi:cation:H+ antiporter